MQSLLSFNEKLGFRKQPSGFATKSIHKGQSPDNWKSKAVVTPLVTSNTYQYASGNESYGFEYSRYKNPTRDVLDKCLASLDDAEHALTFSAGVGALTAILTTLQSGDEILSTENLYGGSIRLFRDLGAKMGIKTYYTNFDDLEGVKEALTPNTKIVWIESPTNPLLTLLDIKAIADVVHSHSKAMLVVDNTFLTAYFQRPLELGADAVMYSISKFINGHSDVVMGAVTTNNKMFYETLKYYQISTGLVSTPSDCYMVLRSLKTLSLRMERHSESSYAVAKFLEKNSNIEKVFHPALKSHKNHELALKQSYGHSGIMSFYIKGSLAQTEKFFKSLKLVMCAQSFGGVETTAAFPWSMSHSDMPEEQRNKVGVTDTLVRLTVGLEDVTEIIADLEQALDSINAK